MRERRERRGEKWAKKEREEKRRRQMFQKEGGKGSHISPYREYYIPSSPKTSLSSGEGCVRNFNKIVWKSIVQKNFSRGRGSESREWRKAREGRRGGGRQMEGKENVVVERGGNGFAPRRRRRAGDQRIGGNVESGGKRRRRKKRSNAGECPSLHRSVRGKEKRRSDENEGVVYSVANRVTPKNVGKYVG